MLKTLQQLLGPEAPRLRRYLWLAGVYALLCGLTLCMLVPVLDHLLAADIPGTRPWLLALLLGLALCWVLRYQVEQAGIQVGVAILRHGRQQLGDHVASLPVGWFSAENTRQLAHVITQGMMTVAQLPAHMFTPAICGAVIPLVLVIMLLILHTTLGLMALFLLPLLAALLRLTSRLSERADQDYQQRFAAASQRVVEFAQAQSVLRAFNGQGGGLRLLNQAMAQQRASGLRLVWRASGVAMLNSWGVQAAFAGLLTLAVMGVAAWQPNGLPAVSPVDFILALLLVCRYIDAWLDLASFSDGLRAAQGPLDTLRTLFATQPLPEPAVALQARDSSVQLQDVCFRYSPQGPDVLRGVNLHMAPGSMTALIGSSGAGKSTLVQLIARFFDVQQGSVRIGGVDVRDMASVHRVELVSQIFQDNHLFHGSIADNIRIARPEASAADILAVVQQAELADLIERLPNGLDTPVGDAGARLSGGERQRITIARALLKQAPILLVDEATAALDTENQAAIAQTLARLRGQRTLLVIAHQLSTLAMADQIVVLEHGQVVESGPPAELLARQGHYARQLKQPHPQGWRIARTSSAAADPADPAVMPTGAASPPAAPKPSSPAAAASGPP